MDVPPPFWDSSTASPAPLSQAIDTAMQLDVPVARVWRALTDPGLIRIWSGQDAEIDPRKGGMYRLGLRDGDSREAHIDIFDVNRRLRLIYLSGSNWPPGDCAVVDDFILDVR